MMVGRLEEGWGRLDGGKAERWTGWMKARLDGGQAGWPSGWMVGRLDGGG